MGYFGFSQKCPVLPLIYTNNVDSTIYLYSISYSDRIHTETIDSCNIDSIERLNIAHLEDGIYILSNTKKGSGITEFLSVTGNFNTSLCHNFYSFDVYSSVTDGNPDYYTINQYYENLTTFGFLEVLFDSTGHKNMNPDSAYQLLLLKAKEFKKVNSEFFMNQDAQEVSYIHCEFESFLLHQYLLWVISNGITIEPKSAYAKDLEWWIEGQTCPQSVMCYMLKSLCKEYFQ